jgi:hypothetical protein
MSGNEEILEAKRKLPLPALMAKLGLNAHAKKSAQCPFCRKDQSFSVLQNGEHWYWKCEGSCGEGDEISFVAKVKSALVKAGAPVDSSVDPKNMYRELAGTVEQTPKLKHATTRDAQSGNGATSAGGGSPPQTMPLGQLLDAVVGILQRYVVFPIREQAEVIALFVIHTWTIEAFDYSPYLHVRYGKHGQCYRTNLMIVSRTSLSLSSLSLIKPVANGRNARGPR